jgi:hypothetical protein
MESDIKRVLIRINEHDVISLDAAADDLGISRNTLIQMILHQYVNTAADRDEDDAVPLPDPAVIKDVNVVNISLHPDDDTQTDNPTPAEEQEDLLGQEGEPFGPPPPDTIKHFHRRGQRLDPPRWVQGQAIYSYRCSEPTCTTILD